MNVDVQQSNHIWQSRKLHLVAQPFALAVSHSAVPTVLVDLKLRDAPIVFANESFLRLAGWDEDEVLGRNLRFFNADGADAEIAQRLEAVSESGESESVDILLKRKSGSPFWARVDLAPIFDPDGRAASMVATIIDVSDRVRATRGLKAAEDRLEQRVEERTEALERALEQTEFLSRELSHRTKNALAILGALIAAKRRRAASEHEAEVLSEIGRRVQAIGRLQGLLDGVDGEENGIDLAEFLYGLCKELDGTDVRVHLHDSPHMSLRSKAALSVALCVTELVLNAQKHAFPDDASGVIEVGARAEDGMISVSVSDGGRGLPEDFDAARSTGLGMLVVINQAEQLGGRITWGRSEDGGAQFTLTFPG